jgi:hypothetical protein
MYGEGHGHFCPSVVFHLAMEAMLAQRGNFRKLTGGLYHVTPPFFL